MNVRIPLLLAFFSSACGSFEPMPPDIDDVGAVDAPSGEDDLRSTPPSHDLPDASSSPGPVVRTPVSSFIPSTKLPSFSDDFDRPDDATGVGNGWAPKQYGAFGLYARTAKQMFGSGAGPRDPLLLRPSSSPDVEISITLTATSSKDDPALVLRVGPSDERDKLDGYVFQVREAKLTLTRYAGSTITTLAVDTSVESILATRDYRLVFRVSGSATVLLEAALIDTTDGYVLGSVSAEDGAVDRYVDAGRMGFGSGLATGARWDDFSSIDL